MERKVMIKKINLTTLEVRKLIRKSRLLVVMMIMKKRNGPGKNIITNKNNILHFHGLLS